MARRKVDRVRDLKSALDDRVGEGERSNVIVVGDLNTMGMDATYHDPDITADEELERYEAILGHADMQYLSKTAGATWYDVDGEYVRADRLRPTSRRTQGYESHADDASGESDESTSSDEVAKAASGGCGSN